MRHPVDRLADIRANIERLEQEESEIRAKVISGEYDSVGSEYTAKIRRQLILRKMVRAIEDVL